MTPQEKDLITSLLERLKQAGSGQAKDPEADALIRKAASEQPDAPYYLVQTVLIQDMALGQAQARIAELERQVAEAQRQPAQPTSFLGGLFGGGATRPGGGSGTVPSAGVWGRAQPAPQAPQYAPPAQPQSPPGWGQPGWGQPAYGQPGYGGPMMGAMGGGGFLRSAAATAAGIAGGALLFQGIQSMFGHGALSGVPQQAGLSETVINNYYGSDTPAADYQSAGYDPGSSPWGAPPAAGGLQYAADQDPGAGAPDAGAGQDYAADPGDASDGTDYAADDPGFGGDDSDVA